MHKKEKIIQSIIQQGILPLYFHQDETTSHQVLESLYESGIRVIEYTNRGKQALKNFSSLKKSADKKFPDLILGLGTVLDSKTASKAIQLHADFLVSPGYSMDLFKLCKDEEILWIPGSMTPTELMQVHLSGIRLVKLFPANMGGTGFIHSVKEIFSDLLFMPTGGIHSENLENWFRAGASAVGIGTGLVSKFIMDQKEFDFLKTNTSALIEQIAVIRSSLV
jgi:2-dehydro-3-deoxyphosphogluconate aldolase/(4S)-4-hydroxy-2-oxoglutarate aldolase